MENEACCGCEPAKGQIQNSEGRAKLAKHGSQLVPAAITFGYLIPVVFMPANAPKQPTANSLTFAWAPAAVYAGPHLQFGRAGAGVTTERGVG